MAKTVKFNLICDGTPIRKIDDLRDNFSIEDILSFLTINSCIAGLRLEGMIIILKLLMQLVLMIRWKL